MPSNMSTGDPQPLGTVEWTKFRFRELNDDDFTDPEVTRTLQILRTRILPDLERNINNPESEEKEEEQS